MLGFGVRVQVLVDGVQVGVGAVQQEPAARREEMKSYGGFTDNQCISRWCSETSSIKYVITTAT